MSEMSNAIRHSISGTKPKTRKDKYVWLIGPISKKLSGKRLLQRKSLAYSFIFIRLRRLPLIKGSSKEVIDICIPFWQKAKIITWTKMHARKRVEKLFL